MPSMVSFVLLLTVLQIRPDTTKATIEGAVIRAGAAVGAMQQIGGAVVQLKPGNASVTTGPSGAFQFFSLTPGRYTLTVQRARFIIQEDPKRGITAGGLTITVVPAQTLRNVVIPMIPSPVISGQVYDPFGEPLAASVVQAYGRRYTTSGRQLKLLKTTLTDDLGEFRLFGLNFGQYVVSANYSHRALAPALGSVRLSANVPKPDEGYTPMFFVDATNASQAQAIRLAPGNNTGSLSIILKDVPRLRIRGRINPALPGAKVFFLPQGLDLMADANPWIQPNARGEFEIQGVSPGGYVLFANAKTPAGDLSSDLISIAVGNSDIENFPVAMFPSVDIAGRVSVERRGNVNLSGMKVKLLRSKRQVQQAFDATTASDGTFTVWSVPADEYDIEIESLPPDTYIKSMNLAGRDVMSGMRTMDSSAELRIVLATAAASVMGHIDITGHAAAGAQVVLIPETRLRRRPDRYIAGFGDSMGNFQLNAVPPGRYTAYAFELIEPGAYYAFAYNNDLNVRFADHGVAVDVRESGGVTVELKAVAAADTAGGFD